MKLYPPQCSAEKKERPDITLVGPNAFASHDENLTFQ